MDTPTTPAAPVSVDCLELRVATPSTTGRQIAISLVKELEDRRAVREKQKQIEEVRRPESGGGEWAWATFCRQRCVAVLICFPEAQFSALQVRSSN